MLNELASESKKVGLTLNPEKTKIMTNGHKSCINVGGSQISYVEEYVYLGQLISPKDNANREIERRIANGWKRYWSLREVMKDKNLQVNTKRKLFNICNLPVLTYGSQTWPITKNMMNKIATCQRAMERSMLGVKRRDRIGNITMEKDQHTGRNLKNKKAKMEVVGTHDQRKGQMEQNSYAMVS